MIDHDRALELAATALDFALSDTDREALQLHLDGCSACRAVDERIRADAQGIADLPMLDAPDDLRPRVLDAMAPRAGVDGDELKARPAAGAGPRSMRSIPATYRLPLAMLTAAAVIVALIGGMLFWRSSPDAGPDVAAASPSASVPSASGSAAPSHEPGPIVADGWTPSAELTADDSQGGVVGLASGFRLASLDGTPATELAARLTADPPIGFAVAADENGRSARITPTEPLTAGVLYRFTLAAEDGRTLDSWAFQAHQPLRIVGTLPRDTESAVPTNTGIEVTFDQDGVVDAAGHVTIEPKVAGRFEQHGRTLAFVPAKRLATSTIYTVTVSRGVAVGGTGEILESDLRFRFETAATGAKAKERTTFQFSDDVFESTPTDAATIAVWAFQDWADGEPEPKPPTTARIEVHRLRDLDAAVGAFRQVRTSPRWAQRSALDLVPTKGLDRVVAFDARLRESDDTLWFQLPKRLTSGWYVLTLRSGSRPVQAILQVTDVAGYLVVSETKTLVWANDLATGGPLATATLATGGADLGHTGADGSLVVDTPADILNAQSGTCTDECIPVLTIRSGNRAAFLPANGRRQPVEGDFQGYGWSIQGSQYWNTFHTDRTLYRRSDTVNTWGVVRDRDTGAVPGSIKVRLFAAGYEGGGGEGAPLSTTEFHPNTLGAFSGSIALNDITEGDYLLETSVADEVLGSRWFRVDRILKPAYRLEVLTGRRVYFQGDTIKVTATATFYEGSPVPGVPLRLDGVVTKSFTTDKAGTATVSSTVRFDAGQDHSGADVRSVQVNPARAEEGAISGASREIIAFPSTWTIGATAVIADARVLVTGSVHTVDRERLEREIAGGKSVWDVDPQGEPVSGRTVTATFTEYIPYRTKTGTRYDFIEKTVVPVYEYGSTERAAGTVRATTRDDGTFSVSIRASDSGHSYRVRLSATDPDKHAAIWIGGASEPGSQETDTEPSLSPTSRPSDGGGAFGVGEPIDLTMNDPGLPTRTTDRYLFYTAQRGIRDVDIQSSARYRSTFPDWAPPAMYINAVRFTGFGYVESPGFQATFRRSDRELTVGLTTDATRYDPGADVTLTVTTRDRAGQPVPATVVLRGVDEKLFTIGGAQAEDPLAELYQEVESGIVATYRSHHEPGGPNGEGGDTGGGGDDGGARGREDFRDWVLFKEVETGPDGRAEVTFPVSDDLTSWRVSASAFGGGLLAGEATIGIPVGLPFFVDATIAPEYLVADRPAIGLRAFGTALEAGAAVTFAVDSDSLGMHVDGLHARAFETETVPLPKLTAGRHEVTITATTGNGASARRDVMTRTFAVVSSRLATTRAKYVEPAAATHLEGGDGRVEVMVSDAGTGRYLPLLLGLTDVASARLERTLAAAIAGTLVTDRFGIADGATTASFDGGLYQTDNGGLALLPYSSSDLEVSVLAALVAPDRFDRDGLERYLSSVAGGAKETRERRMFALAGLGGLRASVLPRIREAAATPGLTIREQLMLGLGAAALGDAATARSIAASLVTNYAEVTNEHARLRVGASAANITAGTALMAMLAAANGDPLAARLWSYVEANPDADATYGLHAVGYVMRMLEHRAPRAASFAYTIAGKPEVVELDAGETFQMSVTHTQLGSLTIEPVTGQVGVTTSWQEIVAPSAFVKDPDLTISRRMTPSGTIGTASLVTVDLTVRVARKAPAGCHLVTDSVPSGLVPVGNLQGWVDPRDEAPVVTDVDYPYAQSGQHVSFCADKATNKGVVHLRYFARVVTSGTYRWEPAVVASRSSSGRAALTKATVVTIR